MFELHLFVSRCYSKKMYCLTKHYASCYNKNHKTIQSHHSLYHTLTKEMLNTSTKLTKTRGILVRISSNTSLRCFSKSSGVRNGTFSEQLWVQQFGKNSFMQPLISNCTDLTYARQRSLNPIRINSSFQSLSIFTCVFCWYMYTQVRNHITTMPFLIYTYSMQ